MFFKENFESFKENFNKNLEKFNKNLKIFYYRFSLLAEAWTVSHPLQIFQVSGGVHFVPPWRRPCTKDYTKLHTAYITLK